MNLILLFDEDFASEAPPGGERIVRLRGRRRRHVLEIVRAAPGDELVVGVANGGVGHGRVLVADADVLELSVRIDGQPPPRLDLTLVLALPRPPVLKRVLAAVTSIGVSHIVLLHTRRVEKTYWQSSAVQPDALRDAMYLGLEQARDTRPPTLDVRRGFKTFVEDELPALAAAARSAVVAHPGSDAACPARLASPCVAAIGPEGGFLDHEIAALGAAGLTPVHLGVRALRVETAVPVLLSRALAPPA